MLARAARLAAQDCDGCFAFDGDLLPTERSQHAIEAFAIAAEKRNELGEHFFGGRARGQSFFEVFFETFEHIETDGAAAECAEARGMEEIAARFFAREGIVHRKRCDAGKRRGRELFDAQCDAAQEIEQARRFRLEQRGHVDIAAAEPDTERAKPTDQRAQIAHLIAMARQGAEIFTDLIGDAARIGGDCVDASGFRLGAIAQRDERLQAGGDFFLQPLVEARLNFAALFATQMFIRQ